MVFTYILLTTMTSFLKFDPHIRMYIYLLFIYISFAYFFAEVVNVVWWIDFIIQMKNYSNCDKIDSDYLQRVFFKEKILVAFLWFVAFAYLFPWIGLTILGIVRDCGWWDPFHNDKKWSDGCQRVGNTYMMSYKILASALIAVAILKIITGLFVLKLMRKNLYFHYKTKKTSIITTIILSWFVNIWISVYSLSPDFREADIKYNFISRIGVGSDRLSYQIIVWIIDVLLPIMVMCINIKTVNFTQYIKDMMGGCNRKSICVSPSIFIIDLSKSCQLVYDIDRNDSLGSISNISDGNVQRNTKKTDKESVLLSKSLYVILFSGRLFEWRRHRKWRFVSREFYWNLTQKQDSCHTWIFHSQKG